jgi:RNA polymerase sigma factor (sigma-70 family)
LQPIREYHPFEGLRSAEAVAHLDGPQRGMKQMAAAPSLGRATGVEAPAAAPGSLAVHTLYERHADRVLAYCAYHLRDRNEADDALQTTFMHALRALQRGVVPDIELAWLLAIARNVCLTRWDKNRRRSQLEIVRDPHVLQEVAPGRESEGEDLFRLQEALEAMPERERRAILLREWQGLSYAEIAADLGLSQSAVETLIFRARRVLANGLRGVQAPSKRRAALGLDLSSLLGALKSLLGGAAVKVAVGAAVVAASVSVGVLELKAERPAKLPSPRGATIPTVSSSPQPFLGPTSPNPRPGTKSQEEAESGSHAHGSSGSPASDTDHSGAQTTQTSGGPGQVASVVPSSAPELAGGAASLAEVIVPVIEQVTPAVLPVVAEAPAAVLQAGEQVAASLPDPQLAVLP